MLDLDQQEQRLLGLYRVVHRTEAYPGRSLLKEVPLIKQFVARYHCKTGLDYGCGKAYFYLKEHVHHEMGLDSIALFDPGVPTHQALPDGPFDAVICTDVLEHIPKDLLPRNLEKIFARAIKFVYFSICTRSAVYRLPNGENAHCTVESPQWWVDYIKELIPPGLRIILRFNPSMDCRVLYRP